MIQTPASPSSSTEKSGEQFAVIEQLLVLAVIHADRYQRDFELAAFHPVHMAIIEKAFDLLPNPELRPYWRNVDRSTEPEVTDLS